MERTESGVSVFIKDSNSNLAIMKVMTSSMSSLFFSSIRADLIASIFSRVVPLSFAT